MANQKFSVEEILKEYQSDEATKGKKESPSGKLETQKMLNHAAGRRNVPPSTEASAAAEYMHTAATDSVPRILLTVLKWRQISIKSNRIAISGEPM